MTDKESKTKLLRSLYQDVQTLKSSIEPAVQASSFIQENFKPAMQKMRDLVTTETAKVADQVASNEQYAKNITSWIKDNLGANLEKMQQQIETTCEEKLAAHLEEIKAREESLWSIFQTKFDKMKDDVEMFIGRMDANYQKMQSQFLVLQEETKKGTAARMSMEQSHAVMKQTHDTIVKDAKERPEQEIALFRKLAKKLEEERKKIEEERARFEEERKKMEEERKKFNNMLKDERKFQQERQLIEVERQRLDEERKRFNQSPIVSYAAPQSVLARAPTVASPQPVVVPVSVPPPKVSSAPTNQTSEVSRWLSEVGYSKYADKFLSSGYDALSVIALLDESDLDILDITLPGHRKAILNLSAQLRADSEREVQSADAESLASLSSTSSLSSSSSSLFESDPFPEPSKSTDSSATNPQRRQLPQVPVGAAKVPGAGIKKSLPPRVLPSVPKS